MCVCVTVCVRMCVCERERERKRERERERTTLGGGRTERFPPAPAGGCEYGGSPPPEGYEGGGYEDGAPIGG